ncbi:MAG: exopolysaccharide Pel transporter PelG [Candidatus Sericytochromatia bacterium]
MAGIGFTLRRMLDQGGLSGPLKAFGAAMVLASGPWVASSLALALMGAWSALAPDSPDARAFLALVSHAFTFSLVAAGLVQMVASRFLADCLHQDRLDNLATGFLQLLLALWALQAVTAVAFAAAVPLPVAVKAAAGALYMALGGTWLAMAFLSAARQPGPQLLAFAQGAGVGLCLGLLGGATAGLTGQLAGFACGQALTLLRLLREIDKTFGSPRWGFVGLWGFVAAHPSLVVTGGCYALGLWIDKLLFWAHPATGEVVAGALRASPLYDEAMYVAYLTVLPALGVFLLKVETDFNDRFRSYFATIAAQRDMGGILEAKAAMAGSVRAGLALVIQVQAPITLALLVGAPALTQALGLSWFSVSVFRLGVLGALFHILHLIMLILLLYLDFRRGAAVMAVAFLAANGLGTAWAFGGGLETYGLGALVAHLLTLGLGYALVEWRLHHLEFHVFMRQGRPRSRVDWWGPWRRRREAGR